MILGFALCGCLLALFATWAIIVLKREVSRLEGALADAKLKANQWQHNSNDWKRLAERYATRANQAELALISLNAGKPVRVVAHRRMEGW